MEGGDSGGEGGREWWCWASRFRSGAVGAVVRFRGCSFSFIAGVVVSWALVISEWGGRRRPWGTVAVPGRCRLCARSLFAGLGVVACGRCRCSWGWALSVVRAVIVRGPGLSFGGAVSSLVGAGCR